MFTACLKGMPRKYSLMGADRALANRFRYLIPHQARASDASIVLSEHDLLNIPISCDLCKWYPEVCHLL